VSSAPTVTSLFLLFMAFHLIELRFELSLKFKLRICASPCALSSRTAASNLDVGCRATTCRTDAAMRVTTSTDRREKRGTSIGFLTMRHITPMCISGSGRERREPTPENKSACRAKLSRAALPQRQQDTLRLRARSEMWN
jgi:hypothetical protein